MKHFLNTYDYTRPELQAMLDEAKRLKESPIGEALKGKTVALLFLNNSLRTRTSFDVGANQLGGHAVVLSPSGGMWPLEFEDGVVMDGDAEEHIAEAAGVLSRYCDLIGVRAFPKFVNWEEDRKDKILNGFAKYASVPVINMETITHPCQEMAHVMALQERMGELDGKKFVLTWTYHPKPLNTAVANSALMIAAKFGMDVTLLCPTPDYVLDQRYMDIARQDTSGQGRSLTVTHDIEEAYSGADVVYAKSWGALPYFGNWEPEKPIRDAHQHFIVDEKKMAMTNDAVVSHCLPMRRNVKMTDAVFDSPACMAYDEAENRLHVQKAIMKHLLG
ncbi:N-acetylornithine carbamoyltransferase [Aquisalinus flavus]|uniref:N-acetylornithine carbamoyltransferase n=1 Tax=Aquisalinus flavus TaxID=1526572 RepID=A0A8J2V361_9PROT|nr:N-acetylornithine carbamoyltransferase [Aquisalinus flavus]MBD0426317.1 N-acetylornithine carbamoyltransferase [Aquisalinus flavus]UNE48116.1 N-acetylornithine carbamoyltransferase [Aquisalinus flavus]GGD08922.1 N-acetylornithine carbamoyltransferase [Aquisalinus flavus]